MFKKHVSKFYNQLFNNQSWFFIARVCIIFKMITIQEKTFCVFHYDSSSSLITVQREFRRHFRRTPPTHQSILRWYRQFKNSGSVLKRKSSGRARVPLETVARVRQCFEQRPQQSINSAGRELGLPKSTVWKILRKSLSLKPYRLQLLQKLKQGDFDKRKELCDNLMDSMQDNNFSSRLVFSDEATFHLNGKVNKHNVRIWASEPPHAVVEHERDSPKCNVFCAVTKTKVYGPFFFAEKTVTGVAYLDMLEHWLFPQLGEDLEGFVFQQDGAPPHWHCEVRNFLNEKLPQRWIGRCNDNDLTLLKWPPRSPDLTVCDFFLWGYVKDKVYEPPMPQTLQELRGRIRNAVESINLAMLAGVWYNLQHRLETCSMANGRHIEHL